MKHRSAAIVLAAVMALTMTACGSKKSDDSTVDMETYKTPTQAETTKAPVTPVSAEEGALLSIKDTTVKPGGVAEVTVHVENADLKWNMCGLHVAYPTALKPQISDAETRAMKKTVGDAAKYNMGFVSLAWFDNLPKELTDRNYGAFFLTAIMDGNNGEDGDIATFYFDVPEDAAPGTVYDIEFFYQEGDLFSNASRDPGYDQFAFDNWKGGKITVE